eukprot:SAG11_NODE_37776_length_255_cov_0.730769_1_plen_56_part_10
MDFRPVKLAIKYKRVESVKVRSLTEIVRDTVRVRVVAAPPWERPRDSLDPRLSQRV